jgi:hypothetical protein
MPWQKKVEIATAAVIGAGALAGTIADSVHASPPSVQTTPKPIEVLVKVPVQVQPASASAVAFYNDHDIQATVPTQLGSAPLSMLSPVALVSLALLLFVGCCILGMGVTYWSQRRDSADAEHDEGDVEALLACRAAASA